MDEKKHKFMRYSRQPFPLLIMIDQNQLENVESFKYLGSILTNNGRCTCEIKYRIAMDKDKDKDVWFVDKLVSNKVR
jgi:hypothetical protein